MQEELLQPQIGQWYYDRTNEREFEVTAVDKDDETIEIQYTEGEVEEVDFDAWQDMNVVAIAEPEGWSGDLDIADDDLDELDGLQGTHESESSENLWEE